MARPRKTPATTPEPMPATHTTVTISDICKAQGITEQAFRLALADIRPDDFDIVKAIPTTQSEQVLATIQATSKALPAQASNNPQLTEAAESQPQQASEPTTQPAQNSVDQPQNSNIVPSAQSAPATQSQPTASTSQITSIDELVAAAKEDVTLADLVLQFRNQQITQNKQARDTELAAQLRESRIETRNQVFDALRGFGGVVASPELPELDSDLQADIDRLSQELGKPLHITR